ncbi:MAG TPA: hypothetical protein VMZ53_29740 [Kofleriaceae bacterium]|nr:hypothetical protein [Kofleriaceae bacterium]
MLLDTTARWLLVLHTALGVTAVGASTHLVLWTRRYLRGQYGKRRAVRRFAWIVLAFQLGAFVAGNIMYPTYKVEVRAAYLENQVAISGEAATHERELGKITAREGGQAYESPATREMVRRAAEAARWFDIKEHWVALGLLASAALLLILWRWNPQEDGLEIAPVVSALAWMAAGTIWFGAIVGVLTASWRAV